MNCLNQGRVDLDEESDDDVPEGDFIEDGSSERS